MDDQGGVLDRIRSAGRNKLHGDELSAFLRDVDELAGCQDREAAIVVVDRLSKSLGLQTPCPQSCYDAFDRCVDSGQSLTKCAGNLVICCNGL